MKSLFMYTLTSLLAINICFTMAQGGSFTDLNLDKGIDCVKRHPVLTILFASVATYGLYTLFKSTKTDQANSNDANFSVEFRAPCYDFQKRLYNVLLAMHFEENNLATISSYFDNLQQFKMELNLQQFETNTALQGVQKRLNDLSNSMNDYLSLSGHKDTKALYDEMLLKYALLLSFLGDANKNLVKRVQF